MDWGGGGGGEMYSYSVEQNTFKNYLSIYYMDTDFF